jgi:zinc protease
MSKPFSARGATSWWALLFLLGCGPALRAAEPLGLATVDTNQFRQQRPLPGVAPEAPTLSVVSHTLANGFRVWGLPWDAGTVSLEVRCRAGSSADPPGQAGLASLLARMMTEGTKTKTSLQQAIAFEDLGASLGHDVASDSLGLNTEVLPEHASAALSLLAEALRDPGLRQDDFERVRKERLDALRTERQDTEQLGWLLASRAILGPLHGRPTAGAPKDVNAMKHSDLVAFHAANINSQQCALFAAGSFEFATLSSSANEAFGPWPTPARVNAPKANAPDFSAPNFAAPSLSAPPNASAPMNGKSPNAPNFDLAEVLFLEKPGSVQSALMVGRTFPTRLTEGWEERQLVNNLFGGLFTSRLNTNLRERHAYSYGAFSMLVATREYGALIAMSNVRTDVTAAALQQIGAEFSALLSTPLAQAEADRARADLSQRQRARLEHSSRLLQNLEEAFAFDLPLDHFNTYAERLRAIDLNALRLTAETFVNAPFIAVVVGDASVPAQLSAAGIPFKTADAAWLE